MVVILKGGRDDLKFDSNHHPNQAHFVGAQFETDGPFKNRFLF